MSLSTNDVDLLIKPIHTSIFHYVVIFGRFAAGFRFAITLITKKQYIIYLGIAWH